MCLIFDVWCWHASWGQTFADARLAAAVVDRLTFRAHIIETGTESSRLRVTTSDRLNVRELMQPPANPSRYPRQGPGGRW